MIDILQIRCFLFRDRSKSLLGHLRPTIRYRCVDFYIRSVLFESNRRRHLGHKRYPPKINGLRRTGIQMHSNASNSKKAKDYPATTTDLAS